jgi:ankyrin repeat protein
MTESTIKWPSARGELVTAVRKGDVKAVKDLLQRGSDVNEEHDGNDTLMHAVFRGYTEIARLLIEKGADVNKKGRYGMRVTPLMEATIRGRTEMMSLLIDSGAEINTTNDMRWTALRYSVTYGKMDAMRLLLDRGADITIADYVGFTVISVTEKLDQTMAQLLKEAQARVLAAEAHAIAVKRQQQLKNRAPKVVIIGGMKL